MGAASLRTVEGALPRWNTKARDDEMGGMTIVLAGAEKVTDGEL